MENEQTITFYYHPVIIPIAFLVSVLLLIGGLFILHLIIGHPPTNLFDVEKSKTKERKSK
jgi:hypothetical protein